MLDKTAYVHFPLRLNNNVKKNLTSGINRLTSSEYDERYIRHGSTSILHIESSIIHFH